MSFFKKSRPNRNADHDIVDVSDQVRVKAENLPPSLDERGAARFAEIYGSSKVEAGRWFLVAIASIVLAMISVLSIVFMLPLKEIRPWVVEVNPTTGVVNKPVEVQKINPNFAVVKSELARWAEAAYTIDPQRTPELLRWANARSADKAIGQFAEFRSRERIYERIQKEPDNVREVKVNAVDAAQDGTAFIYLTTTDRSGFSTPGAEKIKSYRITLKYRFSQATQEKDLLANPLGILVTYFSDAEDRSK